MEQNTEDRIAMVDGIMNRGTIVEVLSSREAFREKLLGEEKLRFFIGFDATAPTLHLSHAKNIILLEKFRKLGHEVIVLFGDFTARIGDPSGESSARKQLTKEEVNANIAQWKEQIKPLMDFDATENPPRVLTNSEWLAPLAFEDVLHLASNVTVQKILERDMFEKRLKERLPIHLHEFLYPLMQGYDSVAIEPDVELCGMDQIFNALMGRTLLQKLKGKEKFVVAVTLMENPKTGELMSKSKGMGVFLNTSARDMFGQVMAQPDEMVTILLRHCTDTPLEEIENLQKGMDDETINPRDAKLVLAKKIVGIFHGTSAAETEEWYFVETFSKKHIQVADVEARTVVAGSNILDVLVSFGYAESKGDARRKIEQGGVSLDGEKITDTNLALNESVTEKILRVGKKHFARLKIQ